MAAFTNFFFVVIIILGGLFSIVFNKIADYIVTFTNVFISNGEVSLSYVHWFSFIIGLLCAAPFLVLFADSIWAVVRAIEKRNSGE